MSRNVGISLRRTSWRPRMHSPVPAGMPMGVTDLRVLGPTSYQTATPCVVRKGARRAVEDSREARLQYGCSTPNEVQAHPWNPVTDRTLVLDMMLTSTCEQSYLQATYDAAAGGVLDAPLASLATDWNKVSITIRGIRDDITNPDVKLSSILLKAKVMAYSLDECCTVYL
jgi:hypothetical protein